MPCGSMVPHKPYTGRDGCHGGITWGVVGAMEALYGALWVPCRQYMVRHGCHGGITRGVMGAMKALHGAVWA